MAAKRVAAPGLIPRARLHAAVDLLRGALPPELADDLARPLILRGLASVWARALSARSEEVELELGALCGEAHEGFVELAGPLASRLPLASHAARVPSGPRVSLPAPRRSSELAAYLGAAHEALLAARGARRRAGAHHTDPQLARAVVQRALAPLASRPVLDLRVCDPAMGSGVFLVEAAEHLAARGEAPLAAVVAHALFGVDLDPDAVALAALALYVLAGRSAEVASALATHLLLADFTAPRDDAGATERDGPSAALAGRGGFDAVIGNPPWVAYAGRAAQPLADARRRFYARTYAAFAGYRTLHGIFVERASHALRPGGRLGLVLPTSVADLDGYAPVRRAHDALCEADRALPDYGADAFEGVFQPSMALLSTRREAPVVAAGEAWDLERPDADAALVELLAALASAPVVPASCFGERGFQSSAEHRALLGRRPDARRTIGLRCGGDIGPFSLAPPSYWVAPGDLGAKLRPAREWQEVALYVRQTARFPMACRSDGAPFRNSILAGFVLDAQLTPDFLVAYLNASFVRFAHYARFRDARQGMPQVKISHLRRTPLPPRASARFFHELAALGAALSARNDGSDADAQARLDRAVAEAWALPSAIVARVEAWRQSEGRVPAGRLRGPRARSTHEE